MDFSNFLVLVTFSLLAVLNVNGMEANVQHVTAIGPLGNIVLSQQLHVLDF